MTCVLRIPFQDQCTIWNRSCTGWRLSGDLPMCSAEVLSLTVNLPGEQQIHIFQAVVRWSWVEEFGVETVEAPKNTQEQWRHYVRRMVKNSVEALKE
jgi:hypothetical protein